MKTRPFGTNKRGEAATVYCFENANGMVMEVTDFGATLHALWIPREAGEKLDVVLGYDDPAGHEGPAGTFFGATVGRNANRIAGGSFTLGGKTYTLDVNNGPNNLHSGLDFWSFRVWQVKETSENSITFTLHSPDGDQGYPGALDMAVTYTLTQNNTVRIHYSGIPQAQTLINLTNHSYFNLNGHDSGDILQHTVWLDADRFTRADAVSIPTGELLPVAGTPMDFRIPKTVGRDIEQDYEALNFGMGYDHNWCLKGKGFRKAAELRGKARAVEVWTDQPGVQFYAGNFINDSWKMKDGKPMVRRGWLALETQHYPNTPNRDDFPTTTVRPGETYKTSTEYRFKAL